MQPSVMTTLMGELEGGLSLKIFLMLGVSGGIVVENRVSLTLLVLEAGERDGVFGLTFSSVVIA